MRDHDVADNGAVPMRMSSSGRWWRDENGTALVEFSFVFMIFVMIAYAIVAFALALNLKQNLTHAVAEGARAAVAAGGVCDPLTAVPCRTAKETAARDRVAAQLAGQSSDVRATAMDPANLDVQFATCAGSTATCITVTLNYPYGDDPIVPSSPGLGIFVPNQLTAASVVQVTN